MKPFNLEAALAGHPICTRDGYHVTQLTLFDVSLEDSNCLAGVAYGSIRTWNSSGVSRSGEHSDLFMAPVKKTGWVARYADFVGGQILKTEIESKDAYPGALSYHEIAWEE